MKTEIKVEGMKCKNCVKHVEDACLTVNGVKKAKASLDDKNVIISGDGYNVDEIKSKIVELGFSAE